jgi:hypothetical protein
MEENNSKQVEYANKFSQKVFGIVKNVITNDMDSHNKVGEIIKMLNSDELDENENENDFNIKEFESYNKLLTILHASLGGGFALYFNNINSKYGTDSKESIDTTYRQHAINYEIDVPTQTIKTSWVSNKASYSPNIKTVEDLIVLFFVITSGFHAYYASNVNGNYEKMIKNRNNWMRWIEYSITSTLMLYIIAILSGVKDEGVYSSIFSINVAMIYAGQLVEEYAEDEIEFMGKIVPKWTVPMTLGFVLLLAEFRVIINSFNKNISGVNEAVLKFKKYKDSQNEEEQEKYKIYLQFADKLQIPSWLNYTIYGLFAFFSSFGFISLYGVVTKQPYEKTEKMYLLLSLLSKAFLGGFVAYGLGERNKVQTEDEPVEPVEQNKGSILSINNLSQVKTKMSKVLHSLKKIKKN